MGIDLAVEFKVFDSFRVAINDVYDFLGMIGCLSLTDGFEHFRHVWLNVCHHLGSGYEVVFSDDEFIGA